MNKAQLINALANKCHLTRKDSDLAVNAMFDIIIDQLEKGEKVQIVGFGTFEVRERGEKKCKNPRTGEEMITPAKKAPVFKAGKALKDAVNK